MAKELLPDALWLRIAPLIPPEAPKTKGGRPRVSDRDPVRAGGGRGTGTKPASGVACTKCCSKSWPGPIASTETGPPWTPPRYRPQGGQETGKNPTDRDKQGTNRHLVVDAQGMPLAVLVSAANVHDSRMMLATVDAIEPIRAKSRGRPRRRRHKLHADKGYDYRHLRLALRKQRIIPRFARCGIEPKNRLGRYRWVVERTPPFPGSTASGA